MLKPVNVLKLVFLLSLLSILAAYVCTCSLLALCNYVLGPATLDRSQSLSRQCEYHSQAGSTTTTQESSLLPRVLRCALIRADS